jgi:hypothetical protein
MYYSDIFQKGLMNTIKTSVSITDLRAEIQTWDPLEI